MSANCTTIRASYGRATGRTVEEVARLAVVVADTGHRHSRGWLVSLLIVTARLCRETELEV
uniref:Uncharacterized protein n=1 Tax=Setaria italica TaxID=4555 RepID=K3YNN4_SETIT